MPTSFTYDVIIRNYGSDSTADHLATKLRERSLRVWHNSQQRKGRLDLELGKALKASRMMVLFLSPFLRDEDWLALEADSFLFRNSQDKERRLLIVLVHNATLRPGLEQYPSFVWDNMDWQKTVGPIFEACLPPTGLSAQPIAAADDCPPEKILSLGHSDAIASAAFSPDGQKLLTASLDHTLRLWESASGKCLWIFQEDRGDRDGNNVSYLSVACNPNGQTALAGSLDGKIRVLDLATGQLLHTLEGHKRAVNSVAWSPDGRFVLSGAQDGTIYIWEGGVCLRQLSGHTGSVRCVAWSPDGRRLLSVTADNSVRIWNAADGEIIETIGNQQPVHTAAWSPDGRMFLWLLADHSLNIRDVETGTLLHQLKGLNVPPTFSTTVVWSPDSGSLLLASNIGSQVNIWDIAAAKIQKKLQGLWSLRARTVAWSPDGSYIFLGGDNGRGQLWKAEGKDRAYELQGHHGLLCRSALSPDGRLLITGGSDGTVRLWEMATGACKSSSDGGHRGAVFAIAWSPDGRHVISGSADGNLRLRSLKFRDRPDLLKQGGALQDTSWSPDGEHILAASADKVIRLWHVNRPDPIREFRGHTAAVNTVKWSPDGQLVLSGSKDTTLRLWVTGTGECKATWTGHAGEVHDTAWSPDGLLALSAAADRTIRVWEVLTGRCLQILEGHTQQVLTVAWSPDGRFALSGSADETVRIWDIAAGTCLYELKGHSHKVVTVAWGGDRQSIFATAANGVMRSWGVSALYSSPKTQLPRAGTQVRYANAKVLLVGDSGVGKTGLAQRLASNEFTQTISTDGAWATHWNLPASADDRVDATTADAGVEREIWLWDFAGQVDYRLVHQLFMEKAAAAVLLFDPQDDNLLQGIIQWDQDLQKATGQPFARLLAAGRIDCGKLVISHARIDEFIKERGFLPPLHETSARKGTGCEELRNAIIAAIDWKNIPVTNSPVLYLRLKQEILKLRDDKIIFIGLADLRHRMEAALPTESFGLDELKTVLSLLDGPGIIRQLDFGDLILLKPEVLGRYAAALVRQVRSHPHELGCIDEKDLLDGNLDYQDFQRLPEAEERLVLVILNDLMARRSWTLRQQIGGRALIVFPSYFRRERPELPHSAKNYTYRFNGPVTEIYATLVVRLSYTTTFDIGELWKDAADFKVKTGNIDAADGTAKTGNLGLMLTREAKGGARLNVWFDPNVNQHTRLIFLRYVYEHLLAAGARDIIPPQLEAAFDSAEIRQEAGELGEESQAAQDNVSKRGRLDGEAMSIAFEAGQLFELTRGDDNGIDATITFRDHEGNATGKKLYLQLKSGTSHLTETRKGEIFYIKDPRHSGFWQDHAYDVMLVISPAKGDIRWMEISSYLKEVTNNGATIATQIVFTGEPYTIASIREWRDKFISPAR